MKRIEKMLLLDPFIDLINKNFWKQTKQTHLNTKNTTSELTQIYKNRKKLC